MIANAFFWGGPTPLVVIVPDNDWRTNEKLLRGDFAARAEAMTPEPLFETFYEAEGRVCLVCCSAASSSALRSVHSGRNVVPICDGCASGWRFHGYYVLKRLGHWSRMWRLFCYKLRHPVGCSLAAVVADVVGMSRWAKKMSALMKRKT